MQFNKSFHFSQAWEKCPSTAHWSTAMSPASSRTDQRERAGTEWLSWLDRAVDFKGKSWVQALTLTPPSFADVTSPPGASISHIVK